MLWLPALSSGGGGRLPLASASVSTLIDALLACPAEQAAGRLSRAVERDPGLALWAVSRASRDSSDPLRTSEQLGEWLARRASEVLVWPEAEAEPLPTEARDEARRLALASVETATLAHELALHRGAPQIAAEECYLLGLLHNAEQWFALPPSLPSGDDNSHCSHASFPFANAAGSRNADVLPGWLIEAIGRSSEDDPVLTAREMLSGRSELPPSLSFDRQAVAAQVHATFALAADALPHCLPALARKLARLRQLEDSFEERLETEKLEAMAEFAAGAGHEINNPIAVIAGRTQLFMRAEHDPERRRELAVMNVQAMRVYEMIADMMLFARPPTPKLTECDVSRLLDKLLGELAPGAARRQIEFCREGAREPLVIQADIDQLGAAVRALIENAIEAMPNGGNVHIALGAERRANEAVAAPRQEIKIAVRDHGPGISPEIRRHLFDPFFSGRGAGRGIGLGLSKAWRIIANHGGRIDVESEVGRGATLTVRLPLVDLGEWSRLRLLLLAAARS